MPTSPMSMMMPIMVMMEKVLPASDGGQQGAHQRHGQGEHDDERTQIPFEQGGHEDVDENHGEQESLHRVAQGLPHGFRFAAEVHGDVAEVDVFQLLVDVLWALPRLTPRGRSAVTDTMRWRFLRSILVGPVARDTRATSPR